MSEINGNTIGKISKMIYKITATRFILLSFLFIILVGTGLLCLPISSRDGQFTPFINSLFTATSATCITGLIVYDTFTHWTAFGQAVILCLIQVGGLGIMTMAAMVSLMVRRKISLKERLLMAQSINLDHTQGIVHMMQKVLLGTLIMEGTGAVVLAIRFIPAFGVGGGIVKGIFHSISAFCNAGFDLMGQIEPYTGLSPYVSDPVVNVTIMTLIIVGGLGFFVWNDLWHFKSIRELRLHTKIVLLVTAGLILVGALAILFLEWNGTLAGLDLQGKMMAPLFQSVTCRTAGYNTLAQGDLTDGTKLISIVLMFIGGSPGSTAGGIKTVTFGVIMLGVLSVVKGSRDINVFGRRLDTNTVMRALAIAIISITVLGTCILFLTITEQKSLLDLMFEAVSAFGTVGLTTGITTELTGIGKMIIIFLMFFGRVGVLTTAVAFASRSRNTNLYQYPEEKVLIG